MIHVMVRHTVADFGKWKPVYDAHASARAKAGLKEIHMLRNIDNPDEVVLLFLADDLGKAKAFAASPDLREAMQKAGVTNKPDVCFLQ
jgi:hypothetical protein